MQWDAKLNFSRQCHVLWCGEHFMAIQDHSVGHAQETAEAADVPETTAPEEFDRNADRRVRVNFGGEFEEASHWQLMQRQSAQIVGVFSSKINSVVVTLIEPYSETRLGRGAGKVSGGVIGHLHGIQLSATKFPNT